MKEFDFYQIAGVIAPGTVVIVGGVLLFFPNQQQAVLSISNVSFGSLGIGMILAYVVGQLLQAIGNGLENLYWWFWGGMPTDWVRTGKHELISPQQQELLQNRLRQMFSKESFSISADLNVKRWYSIVRQVNAVVEAEGRSKRVEIFNGNYGLTRGIAAAFLLLLAAVLITDWRACKIELVLALLLGLSIYRMHRWGRNYGRELFVQFLSINQSKKLEV